MATHRVNPMEAKKGERVPGHWMFKVRLSQLDLFSLM